MLEKLPPDVQQMLASSWVVFVLAWIGRMMYQVQEVQSKHRRFWSLHLIWEMFLALGVGFAADGLASYMGLTGKPVTAVIIVVAYLGPRGVESLIVRGLAAYGRGRKA